MPYDPKLNVRMQAFGLAQKAKLNDLSPEDVEDVRAMAERDLDSNDLLFRAVTHLATQYEINRFDADALSGMGHELVRVVDQLNMPVPPDLNRRDVHG